MNPVWQRIGSLILRWRIPILILIASVTAFMFSVADIKVDQDLARVIPMENDELQGYKRFRELFGDDGNVMVVGLEGNIFHLDRFNALYDLVEDLREVEGIDGVISITHLSNIITDDSLERFLIEPVVPRKPTTQAQVDSIHNVIRSLKFYDGLIINDSLNTVLMAVTLNVDMLNTEHKMELVDHVETPLLAYGKRFGIEPHFAGMPVLRVSVHKVVSKELGLFLMLALGVTAMTLLLFFRSVWVVIFPLIVVGCVIIFSMGLIGLFGYQVSLITAVIPALITVITIPNSVYLITKYHIEYQRTNNKMKALILVIEKIGIVTIMTNATTAVGLGVLSISDINMLREFGIIAGLSVIAGFFISLLLIPIVFSFLPPPSPGQLRHLRRKSLGFVIRALDKIVHEHKGAVYAVSISIAVLAIYGMTLVQPNAFIIDDMPKDSKVRMDLRFIERSFNGALPFEVMIDLKKRKGVLALKNIEKLDELQQRMAKFPDLSHSLSIANLTKFTRQSFFGGDAEEYKMPTRDEYRFIQMYAQGTKVGEGGFGKSLADSTLQITRVSATVRDIGALAMEQLVEKVQVEVDEVFPPDKYDTEITGTTQLFIKGNAFLIENLLRSLVLAFFVIAIIMGMLFKSGRMVVISLIPNLMPLVVVAGLMGYFGIPLKPSTALVFGVAFGIAVDDSIHFLARYKLAMKLGETPSVAVSNSFQDTGVSMIYTSIILFFGFVSFTASKFGGTQALGLLTSLTLGIAMFSNLLLLPTLLLTFDKNLKSTAPEEALPTEEVTGL